MRKYWILRIGVLVVVGFLVLGIFGPEKAVPYFAFIAVVLFLFFGALSLLRHRRHVQASHTAAVDLVSN